MNEFLTASKLALKTNLGLCCFVLISIVIFLFFVMVPVLSIPGNDILFQLSITPPVVFVLMAILAFGNGLLIAMQVYIRKAIKAHRNLKITAAKSATALGIILSSLAATVACVACYSSLLAIFGLGASIFFATYRIPISIFAVALTLVALYFSSRRINSHCDVCAVH